MAALVRYAALEGGVTTKGKNAQHFFRLKFFSLPFLSRKGRKNEEYRIKKEERRKEKEKEQEKEEKEKERGRGEINSVKAAEQIKIFA